MTNIQRIFCGYDKAHGRYDVKRTSEKGKAEGRGATIRGPVTLELWEQHVAGNGAGLGIIPLLGDDTVLWACIDVDVYNLDHRELEDRIKQHGMPLVMARSKSGGAHLFIFFKEPAPAKDVRKMLQAWAVKLGYPGCEIFPKQTERCEEDELGNWLNMPYFYAEKTLRYGIKDGKPLTLDEFVAHAESQKVSELDALLDGVPPPTQATDLEGLCNVVRGAKDGYRNNALNKAAFALGQMIKAGIEEEAPALARLTKAAEDAGLDAKEIKQTLKSGIKGGKKKPPLTKRPGPGVSFSDFYAYMPAHYYIYAPTREPWPATSVDARLGPIEKTTASKWLDQHKPVEQMTWAPGLPLLIKNRLISEGGWIERKGVACFNLYREPTIEPGNAAEADRWLDHVHKIYGDDAAHIIQFLAHRRQRPQEKINHALLLGGAQGIGKDTLLEPAKRAVGPWNFSEVSPQHMLGRFNGFLKSVILRVNEARDLGDVNRYQFYDHLKAYTAAPPDVLRVDEKHLREHSVLNCCGVIITTNYKTDGVYLPADDRRHFVAWSDLTKEDFDDAYWKALWGWYESGGDRHVTAYLAELNLAEFNPKAPPPKTQAFFDIVDANRAPEDAELADVIDELKQPPAITLAMLQCTPTVLKGGDFADWIRDRKNRRAIPHRIEKCGYVPVRNPDNQLGLWIIEGKRQVVYGQAGLSVAERISSARKLIKNPPRSIF